jgi:hypothetical protein
MADVMNGKGFGRLCGLIAEFFHINSRNQEKFRPQYVSAVIRNTYLPDIIQLNKIDPILGAFIKMRKEDVRFSCISVLMHGTNRLPLNGFSRNMIQEEFSRILGNSSFTEI